MEKVDAPVVRVGFIQFLSSKGLISPDTREKLFRAGNRDGIPFADLLAAIPLSVADVYSHLSAFSNVQHDDSVVNSAAAAALKLIPMSVCRKCSVLPVEMTPATITLATPVPLVDKVIKALDPFVGKRRIIPILVNHEVLEEKFGELSPDAVVRPAKRATAKEPKLVAKPAYKVRDYIASPPDPAALPDILDDLIVDAMQAGGSDIHIEPRATQLVVRVRVDGHLQEFARFSKEMRDPVVSRLKVLSQADITERFVPQDGRFTVNARNMQIDIRSSFFRTVQGEKVALRLSDANQKKLLLSDLGFEQEHERAVSSIISKPYGIILVTGPTGSGKTTTIFTFLQHLKREDINITTIEDPNEYLIDGINQCSLVKARGLEFHGALRAILRQDPDIIMLGEIRDTETAEIAYQAALTGHLVFATLHTNDSVSTVGRLLNLGVDKSIVALGTLGIISQRLVRKVCVSCLEEYEPEEVLRKNLGISSLETVTFARGRGCAYCQGRGLRGRVALFEILVFEERLRDAIQRGASSNELYETALQSGWHPLRFSGIQKLLLHETTVEELLAATATRR